MIQNTASKQYYDSNNKNNAITLSATQINEATHIHASDAT